MPLFETSVTRTRTIVETCKFELLTTDAESARILVHSLYFRDKLNNSDDLGSWVAEYDPAFAQGFNPSFHVKPIEDEGPPCKHEFDDGDDPRACYLSISVE